MPGRLDGEFQFEARGRSLAQRREDDPVLRIVVLADLRGRAGREAEDAKPQIAERRLVAVDVDNFDEVLARVEPRLNLRLGGPDSPPVPLVFRNLGDFHPDALHQSLAVFEPLREIRRRLLDSSTFAAAATEWSRAVGPAAENRPALSQRPGESEDHDATMRRLLGRGPTVGSHVPPAQSRAQAGLDRLLREIVAPHIVPRPDPRLPELLGSVDGAVAAIVRSILHHPEFQALESVWRSIHDLVAGIDTDAGVELHLLDVTSKELTTDAATAGRSVLDRLLASHFGVHDASPVWPLVIAGVRFGASSEDLMLLERLGSIASRIGGPLLAGADPSLVGCRSFAQTADYREWESLSGDSAERWRRLRQSVIAPWIGLAMPRVLLRLPYGKHTDPIEAFDFEELPSGRDHEAYLWGNAAFACATLIAASFTDNGTGMQPGDHLELDDLPAAVHDDGDGPSMKPCAEIVLSDASAEKILDAGPMPLLASSRQNAIRLVRFQSIADPPRPLAGKWGHAS